MATEAHHPAPTPLTEAVASLSGVRAVSGDGQTSAASRPPWGTNGTSTALVVLLTLLMGTGGGTIVGRSVLGPDEATTARLGAAEAKLTAQEARLATIEADQQTAARMLREQGRTLLWIVASMQKQSGAIAALAKAQGVEVDLSTPPMLPAGVVDSAP